MKDFLSIFICFFLSIAFVHGQESEDMIFPKARIGWTPSAFVNWHPAIQISFDRRLSEIANVSLESGYVFASFESGQGYRARLGLETFVVRSKSVALVFGLHFTHRNVIGYNTIIRNSTNGEFVNIDYNQKNIDMLTGFNAESKLMFKLSKRIYLDIGGGLGLGANRRINGSFIIINNNIPTEPMTITRVIPQFIFYTHLNLSYAIWQ